MRANRIESLRDRIERVWLALGGPAILQDVGTVENVYRYLDVLETLEDGGALSDVAELESALDLELTMWRAWFEWLTASGQVNNWLGQGETL